MPEINYFSRRGLISDDVFNMGPSANSKPETRAGHSTEKLNLMKYLFASALLLAAVTANAAAVNFNGGPVSGCSLSGTTYTCAASPTSNADDIVLADGYVVTLPANLELLANSAVFVGASSVTGNLKVKTTVAMAAPSSVGGNLDECGVRAS